MAAFPRQDSVTTCWYFRTKMYPCTSRQVYYIHSDIIQNQMESAQNRWGFVCFTEIINENEQSSGGIRVLIPIRKALENYSMQYYIAWSGIYHSIWQLLPFIFFSFPFAERNFSTSTAKTQLLLKMLTLCIPWVRLLGLN